MNKIIFVSNVEDSNKLKKLGTILGTDVSNIQVCYHKIDNSSDYDDIINEYGDNTIITEEIYISAYPYGHCKTVSSDNIESIKSMFHGVKLTDDIRDLTMEYEYKLFINKKQVYRTAKVVKGVISNKKIGKSSVYFENYILNIPEWEMMSKISDEIKEKMTKQGRMIREIYAQLICPLNNIDLDKLRNYTLNVLVKEVEDKNNETSRKFEVLFENGVLMVDVKEYFQTKGWGDWICSGQKRVEINIETINSEIEEYEKLQLELQLEIDLKNAKLKKEEYEKILKENENLLERISNQKCYSPSPSSSSYSPSYNSDPNVGYYYTRYYDKDDEKWVYSDNF